MYEAPATAPMDLRDYLGILKRRAWVIILVTVVVVGVGGSVVALASERVPGVRHARDRERRHRLDVANQAGIIQSQAVHELAEKADPSASVGERRAQHHWRSRHGDVDQQRPAGGGAHRQRPPRRVPGLPQAAGPDRVRHPQRGVATPDRSVAGADRRHRRADCSLAATRPASTDSATPSARRSPICRRSCRRLEPQRRARRAGRPDHQPGRTTHFADVAQPEDRSSRRARRRPPARHHGGVPAGVPRRLDQEPRRTCSRPPATASRSWA